MESGFRVGPWLVEPSLNTISRDGATVHLEPKGMEVLVCLARHPGECLAKEKLLQEVWSDTFVTDDALKRCIFELRRVFGDDAREPRIIQTIPKRGYRLVASVEPLVGIERVSDTAGGIGARKLWMAALGICSLALILALLTAWNVAGLRNRLLAAKGAPPIHSLAVLPLQNLTGDPAQEYFSDGITDSLITDLAQMGAIRVISRTSITRYKKTDKSLPEVARELNVDGIIEGTVQRSGDRVRINVQLLHGPSDKHLWANSYERDLRDVFALQRDATLDIARQVQARLTTPEHAPPTQPRPVDPKALDFYLQGMYHLNRQGRGAGDEEKREAQKYFQLAIDADAGFAPAYNGLAIAHRVLLRGSSEDVAAARRAAERAIELDPAYADARVTLGFIKWRYLDWRGAEEEIQRAVALNPNNARARNGLCRILIVLGRVEEGLQNCRIAQQLDPNNDNLAFPLYMARDYDGSIAMLRMWLRKDPADGESHCTLFENYSKKEMYKEAIEELGQCYTLFGDPEAATAMHRGFSDSGYRGAIRQWAKEVEHLQATNQAYLPGNLAQAYAILGDKDRAFYWLEQAYEHREMVGADGGVFFLTAEPDLDPLRSDPRFKDLLRRVGLRP